jgi:hypothetical protein
MDLIISMQTNKLLVYGTMPTITITIISGVTTITSGETTTSTKITNEIMYHLPKI